MRNLKPALVAHLQTGVTSTALLYKFILADGRVFGCASIDRDVEFDGLIYHAQNGVDKSIIASDTSFSVDNGEGYSLYSTDIPGITAAMALRGELDGAEFEIYLCNYFDVDNTASLMDAGDVGEVKTVQNTVFIPELLSYMMRLRQSIGHVDSRTCRAVFGTDANSQTGCGVDADALWQAAAVASAAADEPKTTFLAVDISTVPTVVPRWRVRWTSGDNVSSRLYQVESLDTVSGQITLLEPLPFAVQPGDEFDIRPDCDHLPASCKHYGNYQLNFKGEDLIPAS